MKFSILLIASLLLFPFQFSKKNEQLSEYLASQNFSGVVLLQSKTGLTSIAAKGFSDKEELIAIDTNSVFKIASVTKLFTATLIMQLVEDRKLSLETTIDAFFNEPEVKHFKRITVKNLLQHTSGLSNETNISYLKHLKPGALIKQFALKKPNQKPGKTFNYNNIDYILLGEIISKIAGKTYNEVLHHKILEPLQLRHTGLIVTPDDAALSLSSYGIKANSREPDIDIHYENYGAAGAIYSTASDLLIFINALKAGELVREESLALLFDSDASLGYAALGCWTFKSPFIPSSPKIMERRGEILSSRSAIMTSIEGNESIVVLSNTDEFDPNSFGDSSNLKEHLFQTLFSQNP